MKSVSRLVFLIAAGALSACQSLPEAASTAPATFAAAVDAAPPVRLALGGRTGHYLNRRLARDLAPDDQALHDAAAASALWSHTKGYGETWHGRDGRTSGTIIPTSRVETVDGALCRQFHDSVVLPGEAVFGVDGTACLKGQAWTVDF